MCHIENCTCYLKKFFFGYQGGEMTHERCVGLAPTKTPSSQATRSHPGKTKSNEPKALNETMLPMRRKKNITISHNQQRTTPISNLISTKEKEWGHEKKEEIQPESKK